MRVMACQVPCHDSALVTAQCSLLRDQGLVTEVHCTIFLKAFWFFRLFSTETVRHSAVTVVTETV